MIVFDKTNKIVFDEKDNYILKDNEKELKCTGWTDKLGQLIYERDIIINHIGIELVVYYNNYNNSFEAFKNGFGDSYITEEYINNSMKIGYNTNNNFNIK